MRMSNNDRHRLTILLTSTMLLILSFFEKHPLRVAGVEVTDNALLFLAAVGTLIGFGAIQIIKLWRGRL